MNNQSALPSPRVGLFVTCLVDLFRPTVGFAAIKLLEEAGCKVEVPMAQTCCGQPAYNSGDRADTRAIAENTIAAFDGFDYVVAPSGSCAGMLRGATRVSARLEDTVTYHDSCSGLRELGISAQPRRLIASIDGVRLIEMRDADVCCGFGGMFCVKYSDISNTIVAKKTENIDASGAKTLLAGDLGCLMNMAGKLRRQGSKVEVRHVAELLAGMTGTPPIAGRG
jgi:L-lactate dehydrogenase complex protein LldE